MRHALAWIIVLAASALVAALPSLAALHPFWPAIAAIGVIVVTRQAIAGLAAGLISGCLIQASGHPLDALRLAFSEHLFPQLSGAWHVGALVFTLLLGAFAGLLEASGGFTSLLNRLLRGSDAPKKRVLGSVYFLGLLCFFDGLANSMLIGRIARPAVDRTGVSREKLAWVVDSTSAPVACVAFISTWIATQLSLIQANFSLADPYTLYFQSIPANPYCLLTLILIPFAIARSWEPGAMKRFAPRPPDSTSDPIAATGAWRVIVPLIVLALAIAFSFQLWSGQPIQLFSLSAWRAAAGGNAGPIALVAGALAGLAAAWTCFPRHARTRPAEAAIQGAAGLLPALVILILAWSLGSVFAAVGAADAIQQLLGSHVQLSWLPLIVFAIASLTSFVTGSSWGTMGLLMPLALQALAGQENTEQVLTVAPMLIGAVFGGAVFGDHCSPFSDTTMVSALASGCRPIDHVITQLPYASTVALAAAIAYTLMALHLPPVLATLAAAIGMLLIVHRAASHQSAHP